MQQDFENIILERQLIKLFLYNILLFTLHWLQNRYSGKEQNIKFTIWANLNIS